MICFPSVCLSLFLQKANVSLRLTADAGGPGGRRQFAVVCHFSVHVAESERECEAANPPRYSPAHSNHVLFSLHPSGDDTNCRTYVRKVRASIDFKHRSQPRKAKVAWETPAQTHMDIASSV